METETLSTRIGIRVQPYLTQQASGVAAKRGLSLSEMVRSLLQEAVTRETNEDPKLTS